MHEPVASKFVRESFSRLDFASNFITLIFCLVAINIILAITIIMLAPSMFNLMYNTPGVAGLNAGRADIEGIGLEVDTHL